MALVYSRATTSCRVTLMDFRLNSCEAEGQASRVMHKPQDIRHTYACPCAFSRRPDDTRYSTDRMFIRTRIRHRDTVCSFQRDLFGISFFFVFVWEDHDIRNMIVIKCNYSWRIGNSIWGFECRRLGTFTMIEDYRGFSSHLHYFDLNEYDDWRN